MMWGYPRTVRSLRRLLGRARPPGLAALLRERIRRMNEQDANKPPASVFDAGAQAVPFIPDDDEVLFADRFGDQPPIRRLSRLDRR